MAEQANGLSLHLQEPTLQARLFPGLVEAAHEALARFTGRRVEGGLQGRELAEQLVETRRDAPQGRDLRIGDLLEQACVSVLDQRRHVGTVA